MSYIFNFNFVFNNCYRKINSNCYNYHTDNLSKTQKNKFYIIFNNLFIFGNDVINSCLFTLLSGKINLKSKLNIKKSKLSQLRIFKKLVSENFFIFLVFKNFKKKNKKYIFFKRYGTPVPKIIWLSIKSLEPMLLLNSLIFILNKLNFVFHRKIIKKIITILLLIG